MYTTKMYCIFLKDPTGKAPVRSVYMVPVVASARERQNKTYLGLHRLCGRETYDRPWHGQE
jgi:hypothetical protein